ncbi:MAG: hypothetical protein INR71_03985 [Terriglobus roseus]|nr:hypothetical protein [Terriglobus roseus]
MMFSLAKERMESSKLWRIVRRMPKGALLHCHLEAMVDMGWLIEEAIGMDDMCVKTTEPLTDDVRDKGAFKFQTSKSPVRGGPSMWTSAYQADTLVPLVEFADTFPDGGRAAFISWFRSRTTITHEESLKHHKGINEVWRKFTSIFAVIGSLIFHESLFRKFIRRIFRELREDGVQYVEFRHGFVAPYSRDDAELPDEDFVHFLTAFREELDAFKATEEGADFWGARFIWSAIRRFDNKAIADCSYILFLPFLSPHSHSVQP